MDKYQKFWRHIRFCFSASIGGIFYVIKYCADPACWNVYELDLSGLKKIGRSAVMMCFVPASLCQYPLYAVPDKHTAENRTSNTKISFLTVRRRQKIKDAWKNFLFSCVLCVAPVRLVQQADASPAFCCISLHSIYIYTLRSPDQSVQTHDPVPVQLK